MENQQPAAAQAHKQEAAAQAHKQEAASAQAPAKHKETVSAKHKETVSVTYIPINDGDPHTVVWNGVRFVMNKPVELHPSRHAVEVLLNDQIVEDDGSVRTVTKVKRLSMVKMAQGNPAFQVEGRARAKVVKGSARPPMDSRSYRQYALTWITQSITPDEMVSRWEAEAGMREMCSVGDEDLAYIQPFFSAQMYRLKLGVGDNSMSANFDDIEVAA